MKRDRSAKIVGADRGRAQGNLPASAFQTGLRRLGEGRDGRAGLISRSHAQLLDLAAALPLGASLLVIAFPGSRGTASLVDQARRLSRRSAIPIEVIEIAAAA